MKVWKIITDLTPEQNENLDEIFSDEDQMLLYKLGKDHTVYNWDHVTENTVTPYVICDEDIMDVMCNLCDRYDIKWGPIEITEEFLMGLHWVPDVDFTIFRELNITEDIIYDKIKKFGGKSLDDLEKSILKNC